LAVGDAVGTAVEFKPRGSFEPLQDMVGGGPFSLRAGEWTDDTSMALCLAASLLECGGFDAADQMHRYVRWRDEGYMSSNGRCFDIGGTVSNALFRFQLLGEPYAGVTHPRSAGNGCIMRLAPVPMYFAGNREQALHFAVESSRTTHATAECLEACRLFASQLFNTLNGADRETILSAEGLELIESRIVAVAKGDYLGKHSDQVRGSGYVVESLEAALWCFYHSSSFEEAILAAANLGDDADTTAAVCGQVAGAYYGVEGIPGNWLRLLAKRELIQQMADDLCGVNR
jgi:ADP-ribosyl-[dinitrogen reductase] hydrolase